MSQYNQGNFRPDEGDPYPVGETSIQRLRRYVDTPDITVSPPEWRSAARATLYELDSVRLDLECSRELVTRNKMSSGLALFVAAFMGGLLTAIIGIFL